MTSRERLLSALRREPVDYTPCCALFNPLNETFRRGHKWNFPWPPTATPQEELQYQVEHLGLDQIVSVWANLCRPVVGVESNSWLENGILHKSYRTPAGELHASVRYNEYWPHGRDIPFYSDFNVGHFVEPWIQNEADLACFTQVVRLCDTRDVLAEVKAGVHHARQLAERYRRIRQMVDDPVLVAGYANGDLGYLPTAQAYTDGGYEVAESPFAPQAEDLLVATAMGLAQELRRTSPWR